MRSRGIANKTLMSPGIVQGFAAAMIENAGKTNKQQKERNKKVFNSNKPDKIVAKWKARGDGVILVAPQMDSYTTDSNVFFFSFSSFFLFSLFFYYFFFFFLFLCLFGCSYVTSRYGSPPFRGKVQMH